jgi:hypothetical protein
VSPKDGVICELARMKGTACRGDEPGLTDAEEDGNERTPSCAEDHLMEVPWQGARRCCSETV